MTTTRLIASWKFTTQHLNMKGRVFVGTVKQLFEEVKMKMPSLLSKNPPPRKDTIRSLMEQTDAISVTISHEGEAITYRFLHAYFYPTFYVDARHITVMPVDHPTVPASTDVLDLEIGVKHPDFNQERRTYFNPAVDAERSFKLFYGMLSRIHEYISKHTYITSDMQDTYIHRLISNDRALGDEQSANTNERRAIITAYTSVNLLTLSHLVRDGRLDRDVVMNFISTPEALAMGAEFRPISERLGPVVKTDVGLYGLNPPGFHRNSTGSPAIDEEYNRRLAAFSQAWGSWLAITRIGCNELKSSLQEMQEYFSVHRPPMRVHYQGQFVSLQPELERVCWEITRLIALRVLQYGALPTIVELELLTGRSWNIKAVGGNLVMTVWSGPDRNNQFIFTKTK